MKHFISSIWTRPPSDLNVRIEKCVAAADAGFSAKQPGCVYFRADDVAAPAAAFHRMMDLFSDHGVPLSLAVVPAWLTRARWKTIQAKARGSSSLWCWHQHGWRHANHQTAGKKQEFGSARPGGAIRSDLLKGRQRLELIMGNQFYPVFTPPWNRCNSCTLKVLKQSGYVAVSRDCGAQPRAPAALPDHCMHIDLHTREAQDPVSGWNRLFEALEKNLFEGRCGIMLHHQKMNAAAFDFLEVLLQALKKCKNIQLVNFKDLI